MLSIRLVPLLIWAGAIAALSSFSNPPGPQQQEWSASLAHGAEYALLAFLAARWATPAFPRAQQVRLAIVLWLCCMAFGASDELHQSFVPGRDASYLDWAMDALGAGLGLLAWHMLRAAIGAARLKGGPPRQR